MRRSEPRRGATLAAVGPALRCYGRLLGDADLRRLARAFVCVGVAFTMGPVAIVLFARHVTGTYSTASLVLAAYTVGQAVLGPPRGRLVDRRGPRRAVLLLAVPTIVTDLGLVAAGAASAPGAAIVGLAFVSGAATSPANVAIRAAWSRSLVGTELQHTGDAALKMMQEGNYIAGPLIAGVCIGVGSVYVALIAMALLTLTGTLLFATAQAIGVARGAPVGAPADGPTAATSGVGSGVRLVVGVATLSGVTFGALDVALPALARAHGASVGVGILLSALAVGILVGSFLYGLTPAPGCRARVFPPCCLLAALGVALLALPGSLASAAGFAVLAGLAIAPMSTCLFSLIEEVSHEARRGEAFAWFTTTYSVGLAVGAAVAGRVVESSGASAAMVVGSAPMLLAAAAFAALSRRWIAQAA